MSISCACCAMWSATRCARGWREVCGDGVRAAWAQRRLDYPPSPLETGPVAKSEPWQEWVDQHETESELTTLRRSVARGVLFGAES